MKIEMAGHLNVSKDHAVLMHHRQLTSNSAVPSATLSPRLESHHPTPLNVENLERLRFATVLQVMQRQ